MPVTWPSVPIVISCTTVPFELLTLACADMSWWMTLLASTSMPVPAPTFIVLPLEDKPVPQVYAAAPVNWTNVSEVVPSVIESSVQTHAVSALVEPCSTKTAPATSSVFPSASVARVGAPLALTV